MPMLPAFFLFSFLLFLVLLYPPNLHPSLIIQLIFSCSQPAPS